MDAFRWKVRLARASISLALLAGVIWGSLTEPSSLSWLTKGTDKLHHFLAYLGLAAWFSGITGEPKRKWVAPVLIGMGGGLELLQHVMGMGRMADYKDFIANSAGVILGSWLGIYAFRYTKQSLPKSRKTQ